MKPNPIKTVFRWIAWILGGLMIAFFLMFFIGEGVPDLLAGTAQIPKPVEMISMFFIAATLIGLLIAFWKPLVGGLIACIAAGGFIGLETYAKQQMISVSDGWAFYLLFLAGFLHIVSWSLRRQRKAS
jgi:hypothetical protein